MINPVVSAHVPSLWLRLCESKEIINPVIYLHPISSVPLGRLQVNLVGTVVRLKLPGQSSVSSPILVGTGTTTTNEMQVTARSLGGFGCPFQYLYFPNLNPTPHLPNPTQP